jgi:hypothetical protein
MARATPELRLAIAAYVGLPIFLALPFWLWLLA